MRSHSSILAEREGVRGPGDLECGGEGRRLPILDAIARKETYA